jgi:hypothetical protein
VEQENTLRTTYSDIMDSGEGEGSEGEAKD